MNEQTKQQERVGITVECVVCKRIKKPHGRSGPPHRMYCDRECPGYQTDPLPGCLWPGETESDFGYVICGNAVRMIDVVEEEQLAGARKAIRHLSNYAIKYPCGCPERRNPADTGTLPNGWLRCDRCYGLYLARSINDQEKP